ncbi:uncharacterized protein LOC135202528 isoform X2 [Macrobrachium nipponense]|uniref:uncharacterized protein LOC135202528 isoform X2 n=1 Tax=Macrobrachium nipponense TaxID=159736 RepID=UPI0030C8CED2
MPSVPCPRMLRRLQDGEIGSVVLVIGNASSLFSHVDLVEKTDNTPTNDSENISSSLIPRRNAHESNVAIGPTSIDCNTIRCNLTDKSIPSKDDKETKVLSRNLTSASINMGDNRTRSFTNDSTNREPSHYLIQTAGCNILDFPLSHPDIVKYTFKEVPELVCSNAPPLTEDSGLTLTLREDRIADYGLTNTSLSCLYRGILRVQQDPKKYNLDCDRKFKLKEEIPIVSRETHIDEDAILVTCRKRDTQEKPVYQNVHFFIQPTRAERKRDLLQAERTTKGGRPEVEKLSVVILGTDAVSRANLERHMPKTHDYLTNRLNSISLKGLTKIADNTHPNIIALLTGLSMDELRNHKCRKGRSKSKFDDCPIIWRDFSKKGYVTAYAEDTPHIGSFHHNMHGFVEQPTDYYNRPYYIAAENFTGHSGNIKGSVGYLCQGARKSISIIHNYSLAVAQQLQDIPYFGYYWTTSMTHDFQKAALRADEPCYNFLRKMKEKGFLNHTILFFISDHGMRQGEFRSTYAGMLEERLPYANVVFPDWFLQKYPEAIKNMRTNTKRLTSTYDLHVTLRDILDQNYKDPSTIKPRHKKGHSLFQEISGSRTCRDAGIPNHYCACESTTEADAKDIYLKKAAKHAVATLNEGLAAFPNCSQLRLDQVMRGRVGTASRNTRPKMRETAITSYIVTFSTVPGGAIMEASVKRRKEDYKVSSEISRINMYGNQSHCISDEIYRKYCFCNDLLR